MSRRVGFSRKCNLRCCSYWLLLVWGFANCCCVFVLASEDNNSTESMETADENEVLKGRFNSYEQKPKPKFLTFNTRDDEISIEMTLGVPFLSIPMKNSSSGVLGSIPSVNVNIGAVALSLGVTLGTIYVAPLIGKLFALKKFSSKSRVIENDQSFMESIVRIMEDQGIPVQECVLRAVCTLVKRSVESQNPTSKDKIVDGIASNEWLMSKLEGSVLLDAISLGKSHAECSRKYSRCKINHNSLQILSKFLSSEILDNSV